METRRAGWRPHACGMVAARLRDGVRALAGWRPHAWLFESIMPDTLRRAHGLQVVGAVRERSNFLSRQFLRRRRYFTATIYDAHGRPLIEASTEPPSTARVLPWVYQDRSRALIHCQGLTTGVSEQEQSTHPGPGYTTGVPGSTQKPHPPSGLTIEVPWQWACCH